MVVGILFAHILLLFIDKNCLLLALLHRQIFGKTEITEKPTLKVKINDSNQTGALNLQSIQTISTQKCQ